MIPSFRAERSPRVRLPAFGRALLDVRRQGMVPSPPECFVCLDSWEWARQCTRVVVSDDTDPSKLDFSMLAGLKVFAIYDSGLSAVGRREALVEALRKSGVAWLHGIDMREPTEGFLAKSRCRKTYSEMTHKDHVENCDRLVAEVIADRARAHAREQA